MDSRRGRGDGQGEGQKALPFEMLASLPCSTSPRHERTTWKEEMFDPRVAKTNSLMVSSPLTAALAIGSSMGHSFTLGNAVLLKTN